MKTEEFCLFCGSFRDHELMGRNMKQTVFAVPMTCESCVKDVSGALHQLKGITKVEANLQDQLLSVEGTGMESLVS